MQIEQRYVLVPVEPTAAMIAAAHELRRDASPALVWEEMIAARPAVGEDVVERVARSIHACIEAFPNDIYLSTLALGYDEVNDVETTDLVAVVDGEVNFSALARAAIVALGGAAPLTDPQPVA